MHHERENPTSNIQSGAYFSANVGWPAPYEMLHHFALATGPGEWFVTAGVSGILGVAIGALLIPFAAVITRLRG